MAIFKCKMCSHYDGEWCSKERLIKTRRNPCESCKECRIKLNEKLSFCPYQTVLPDWLVWVLSRLGFSIAAILAAFMSFFALYFTIWAVKSILVWSAHIAIYELGTAILCLFLTILCKSLASWLHKNYF